MELPKRRGAAEWLVIACGVWQIGLGLYFIFVRPALLPEDPRYMGVEPQVLQATVPRLADWLNMVFTVLGGFMTGAGVLTGFFAWSVMPLRLRGTTLALALAGAMTVALMSAVNFALHSDFRWLLVVPPIAWAIGLLSYIRQTKP